MKRPALAALGGLLAAALLSAAQPAAQAERTGLMARLQAEGAGPLSERLTPLLLDYLETVIPDERRRELYAAKSRADFLGRVRALTGKSPIDLWPELFAWSEAQPVAGDAAAWTELAAGPFLIQFHPGSRAEADREIIARQLMATAEAITAALGLETFFARGRAALRPESPAAAGLIPVRLFSSRREAGASKIRSGSAGSATLGATIVDGSGKLTFVIDVLYWNALSLAVLEHEAAHAVVLLSAFDTAALTAAPLKGKADLEKAFRAGFRKIPAFLLEGLGDWAYYFHGLQKAWGLLPSAHAQVEEMEAAGRTVPLADLSAGDARFATRNRKSYALQAASFLAYLLDTGGRDKVRAWLMGGSDKGVRPFDEIFGRTLAEAESGWRAARKESPR